jgi:hypothetical protein
MTKRFLIPRHWLFLIAGIVWTGVGILLWSRAILWSTALAAPWDMIFTGTSIIIAAAGYRFGFTSVVRRNVERIRSLPVKANPLSFTGARGYMMIVLMIGLGTALRNSALPKVYLSIPYASMGGVLLLGSLSFYRNFLKEKDAHS